MEIPCFKEIRPSDRKEMEKAAKRWANIAKPIYGLGKLEDAVIKIAGISGAESVRADKPALVVMCGDHGVVAEGVTQTGMEVTALVTANFEKGKTSASIMAEVCGADVFAVDIGINGDFCYGHELLPGKVCGRKIAKGSNNIAVTDAMDFDNCIKAVMCGIDIAGELKSRGYNVIAAGEMGIGNTTPASAIAAVLLHKSASETTGKGAGLSNPVFLKKIETVNRIIGSFRKNYGDNFNGLDVLKSVGGYDIAGMAGLFLGGGIHKIPVVADGFISAAAAMCAVNINPAVKDYMFASHISKEPFGNEILSHIGLEPYIDCGMGLGEGTGALAAIPLFNMAAEVYNKMITFGDLDMESYVDYEGERK